MVNSFHFLDFSSSKAKDLIIFFNWANPDLFLFIYVLF